MSNNPPASAAAPQVLCGRFMLLEEFRHGGMGIVQKAVDLQTNEFAAIKRMRSSGDQQRLKTSFHREVEAVRTLDHPNIVKFLMVDQGNDGKWFLAMEWIDKTLESYVISKGPLSWRRFASQVGFPILSALEYAQGRRIVHRDLNPRNIMMTPGGFPKITDYGIAKILEDLDSWVPVRGNTFFNARTPGYSPKEADDHVYSRSRDCYSLAAIAVFCLVARKLDSDAQLAIAVNEAPFPQDIRPLIESCLSDHPRQRPFDAAVMRAELERIEQARVQSKASSIHLYLELSILAEEQLRNLLGIDSHDSIEQFILDELAETSALTFQRTVNRIRLLDRIEIIGVSWRFRAGLAGRCCERLEIVDAWEIEAARASRLREAAYRTPVSFSFDQPENISTAADQLRELLNRVALRDEEQDAAQRAITSERILRAWKGYLRDRLELETARQNAIHFTNRRIRQNLVVFTADIAPASDIVGEERLVRVGGLHVFGRIKQVIIDHITFEVTKGDPEILPRRGELLLNTSAAERALAYQSTALDAVMYERVVNPRLKAILLEPDCARAPEQVDASHVEGSRLEGEKVAVLHRALGTTEILAIEGPPGTGKTDLISDIAVAWLRRNPGHRILLSSQTHTALDEAIDRIAQLATDGAATIVRIGRMDDDRIADTAKPLMLEKKVELWAADVRRRAEENMAVWAAEHGVDPRLVALGMKVERLGQILRQRSEVERRVAEEEAKVDAAEDRLSQGSVTPDEGEELDLNTMESGSELTLLKETLSRLRRQERAVRAALGSSIDLGPELAKLNDLGEIEEWKDVYLNGDEVVRNCRARLALLEDWFLKVGRTGDFNAAVLNDANIIAATCVGIATVRGIEDVEYDLCIVDEASKATATEILIPLSRSRRWIIVGDPKPLPPFFEEFGEELLAEYDEKSEVRPTILDRMVDPSIGLPKECRTQLRVQYRMIAPIGNLVSDCFYDRMLQSPITSHGINLQPDIPAPVTWYTTSRETRSEERPVGNTFANLLEIEWARHVLDRVQSVAMRHAKRLDVAIITGYTAQVQLLTGMTKRNASDWPNLKVSCNSVHAFQGKQADICIYSVVRSNPAHRLGFLKEKPLLNVALSRAKSGLILIGDHHFCRTAKGENPFKAVIDWVEGHLRHCHIGPLRW
jgi:serine/threonine protein kinase